MSRWAAGRTPRSSPVSRKQEVHLLSLVHSGEYGTVEVAELCGVGHSTTHRVIQRPRLAAEAEVADLN